jgi:NAD(P)-dependent dehydrogenase (short-subunit alcohol dehydrogenase family)
MELGLADRVALITGASKGIGRAIALRLAREGADLVLCARQQEPLAELAVEIEKLGRRVVAVPCDVTNPASPGQVLEQARREFPGIDLLINNAGASVPKKLLSTTDADWLEGLELNLLSAVRFTRSCIPRMQEQRWGRIVNIASTTAKLADPYFPIYGAAKAALLNFSKAVSVGFAADGIRCNAVLPGITRTELVEQNIENAAAASGASADVVMERMLRKWPIAIGRIGEPAEVADAVAFLCSVQADWITGVALPVDGGTIPIGG